MNKQLWYFSADWCGPCKTFGPTMDRLEASGNVGKINRINIDHDAHALTRFGIKSVPTVILVENEQEVKQGDVIGTVGKTGRSTGAHLDIRLNWFDVKLDPASVLDLN